MSSGFKPLVRTLPVVMASPACDRSRVLMLGRIPQQGASEKAPSAHSVQRHSVSLSWEVTRSQGKIMERKPRTHWGCLLKLAVVAALVMPGAASGGELRSCFTPAQNCTALILEQINAAQSELLVQAYGFTSPEIIQAIGRAKERGVDVNVILDRVNEQDRYTGATYLLNHDIDPLIDDRVVIGGG
jgi:phosphatidylserine/phosphatidylglycerophosphate/cardiolipin synthase-like enzyme